MRIINADLLAEASKRVGVYPVELVKISVSDNSEEDLNLTSCYRDIEHNNDNYIAGSHVLSLSSVEEQQDVKTNGINVTLGAVPNTIIGALEQVDAIGGTVTIYQALFDTNTNTTVGEVLFKWQGQINSHSVDEDNQAGTVMINIECKNIVGVILNTKSGRFTSDTSFQEHNDGDRSMEFVASLVAWNPHFGRED